MVFRKKSVGESRNIGRWVGNTDVSKKKKNNHILYFEEYVLITD